MSRYPPGWKAISLARKKAADWRCEFCGAAHGEPHPVTGSNVVLTVAHLSHEARDNRAANLRALCQRCHLAHDKEMHGRMRRRNAARKQGQGSGVLEMEEQ